MDTFTEKVGRFAVDVAVIIALIGAAVACWWFGLPAWLLAICVILLLLAVISLLGDLGVFGGVEPD